MDELGRKMLEQAQKQTALLSVNVAANCVFALTALAALLVWLSRS